ncbi:NifU family protein [Sandaracinus amylolyticus]|nr:NifU family protein [Sandaracinus amylolyticus]
MSPRADLERMIDEILRPLLEADGGGIELVSFDGDELVLSLTGAFRGDPGAPYVQQRIVRPAVRKALGRDVKIKYVVARDERVSPSRS